MRFAYKVPVEIRSSTHFEKFETACRNVEQEISRINGFGIESINITFIYSGQFDIFYKATASIFIIWNSFCEKTISEIEVSLAHEVGHHVIEQQETFGLFKEYILTEFGEKAVKILGENYLNCYSKSRLPCCKVLGVLPVRCKQR
jgi:hypothetical protein